MLKLSRKSVLALEAVLDIAFNARPDPVQASDITTRQGIPRRYLEQVLQSLVRDGILHGVRGPRGGYTLALERRRVTLGDVLRVVGTLDDEEGVSQAELGEKVIAPLWAGIQKEILEKLDEVTMEDLCLRAADLGIQRADGRPPDYAI